MTIGDLRFVRTGVDAVAKIVHELDNGGRYVRKRPTIVDAPQYIYDSVMSQIEHEIAPPRAFIAEIKNAIVRPPGFIYTDRAIVEECLVNLHGTNNLEHWMPVKHIEDDHFSARQSDFLCGNFVEKPSVLLAQNSDINYGHWIVECLPKLDLINQIYDIKNLSFIIGYPNKAMDRVYYDSLRTFGISDRQIIQLDSQPTYFTNLIYPGPVTKHPWITSPRSIRFLGKIPNLLRDPIKGELAPSRIYLPRNQIGRRRLLNEDQIWNILERHGFVQIRPESLTFDEQVAQMSNASVVVGNLGGALSNIVFSPDGLSLVAISTEFMADDFFFDIVTQKGGSYTSVHGKATDPNLGMQSDFFMNLELFNFHLEKIIDAVEKYTR